MARGDVVIVALVVAAAVALGGARSEACSFIEDDVRFFRYEAPAGGLWWLHVVSPGVPESVTLVSADGSRELSAAVASRGPAGSIALRVPDGAVAGDRFLLPDAADVSPTQELPAVLSVVAEPLEPPAGAPDAPELVVEQRVTRVGYRSVATVDALGECEQAPGLWEHLYGARPYLSLDVPEGMVLDVSVAAAGEPAFAVRDGRASRIVFDARMPGSVGEPTHGPPDAPVAFDVHARLRRVADAAESEVVTEHVILDVSSETRLEWVGCSSSGDAAAAWALLALLSLPPRRRRRG